MARPLPEDRIKKMDLPVKIYNGETKNVTSALTFAEDGEEKICGIMVKNNFKDQNLNFKSLHLGFWYRVKNHKGHMSNLSISEHFWL